MASEYYHIYFNFTARENVHTFDTSLGAITHMAFNHFIFINYPPTQESVSMATSLCY